MPPRKKPGAAEAAPEATVDASGQIAISLEKPPVRYCLRPSRKAISAIEDKLGLSLAELALMGGRAALALDQMAVIVAETMRAYGEANPADPLATSYTGANVEKLADLIYDAGVSEIRGPLVVMLYAALTGGYTASGEAKPAEKKTE